jgi:hypothetical protein
MLGNSLLRCVVGYSQFADRCRSGGKPAEDRPPSRIERAESVTLNESTTAWLCIPLAKSTEFSRPR